jgi:hypothetical protein
MFLNLQMVKVRPALVVELEVEQVAVVEQKLSDLLVHILNH